MAAWVIIATGLFAPDRTVVTPVDVPGRSVTSWA